MRGAPGLHASNVYGAAEVVAVGGLGQPAGLAGGLAGAPAGSCAAVPLALTAAMVGDEKLPARHALALSRLGHRRSRTNPSSATTTPTERSSARSLKKTESGAEEDRQRRRSEEDGSARTRTFRPAERRQIQAGAHTRKCRASEHDRHRVKRSAQEPLVRVASRLAIGRCRAATGTVDARMGFRESVVPRKTLASGRCHCFVMGNRCF